MDAAPDYASCSFAELVVLRGRINRRKFPERYQEVVNLIQQRQPNLTSEEREAVEEKLKRNWKGGLISLAFLIAGLLALIFGVIYPTVRVWQVRNWTPTPCVVHFKHQLPMQGDDMHYTYSFGGKSYDSTSLTASINATRDNEWEERYPDGLTAQCYVNPSDPQQAVLTRNWGGTPPFMLVWSVFMIGVNIYRFLQPGGVGFKNGSLWTQKERRRISFEDILNRDEK